MNSPLGKQNQQKKKSSNDKQIIITINNNISKKKKRERDGGKKKRRRDLINSFARREIRRGSLSISRHPNTCSLLLMVKGKKRDSTLLCVSELLVASGEKKTGKSNNLKKDDFAFAPLL